MVRRVMRGPCSGGPYDKMMMSHYSTRLDIFSARLVTETLGTMHPAREAVLIGHYEWHPVPAPRGDRGWWRWCRVV